jgi:hypothetical protein
MNKNKKTFKIFLDSFNAASYTGTQFNASFYVDLKTVISNDEDFDKSYNVYVNFRTLAAVQGASGIASNARLYLLNIDFNKGLNTLSYGGTRQMKNICHILNIKTTDEDSLETVPVMLTYLELKDSDQMPSVVHNLRNVNTILLQVLTSDNFSIFAPGVPANSRYCCILTFVEM